MSNYMNDLDLTQLDEKAYVWVGREFPPLLRNAVADDDEDSQGGQIPTLIGVNRALYIPEELGPVMGFLRYPRPYGELKQWMTDVTEDGDALLAWLEEEGLVIALAPKTGSMASLGGLHLEPNAMLLPEEGQEGDEPIPGLTMISDAEGVNTAVELTPITRALLFGYPDEALAEVIGKIVSDYGVDSESVTGELLKNLAMWMRDDFAFLLFME